MGRIFCPAHCTIGGFFMPRESPSPFWLVVSLIANSVFIAFDIIILAISDHCAADTRGWLIAGLVSMAVAGGLAVVLHLRFSSRIREAAHAGDMDSPPWKLLLLDLTMIAHGSFALWLIVWMIVGATKKKASDTSRDRCATQLGINVTYFIFYLIAQVILVGLTLASECFQTPQWRELLFAKDFHDRENSTLKETKPESSRPQTSISPSRTRHAAPTSDPYIVASAQKYAMPPNYVLQGDYEEESESGLSAGPGSNRSQPPAQSNPQLQLLPLAPLGLGDNETSFRFAESIDTAPNLSHIASRKRQMSSSARSVPEFLAEGNASHASFSHPAFDVAVQESDCGSRLNISAITLDKALASHPSELVGSVPPSVPIQGRDSPQSSNGSSPARTPAVPPLRYSPRRKSPRQEDDDVPPLAMDPVAKQPPKGRNPTAAALQGWGAKRPSEGFYSRHFGGRGQDYIPRPGQS